MAPSDFHGTILFSTIGRTEYAFDIFSISLPRSSSPSSITLLETILNDSSSNTLVETLLTDSTSINYNGHFAPSDTLVYISERNGCAQIFFKQLSSLPVTFSPLSPLQAIASGTNPCLDLFYDRPSIAADKVFFVSTQQPAAKPRQPWNAVYCTSLNLGTTLRLSPAGVTDFSPCVSPSGKWVAVASYGSRWWEGEIEHLHTDIYIFKADDGLHRTLVAQNGGWPTWANDNTLFFHRRADDGWWSIYRVNLPFSVEDFNDLQAERITPPCVHAFTPAASQSGEWLAVATRRPDSKWRHIEIFLLASRTFVSFTSRIHPEVHHYNPFVSPSSDKIGYHRTRARDDTCSGSVVPFLEVWKSPLSSLSLFRVKGFFPSVSPCGKFIAYQTGVVQGNPGIFVLRMDGSKKWNVFDKPVFGTAWDMKKTGLIYSSYGASFSSSGTSVHVIAISFDLEQLVDSTDKVRSTFTILTKGGTANNAFPFPSPDGKEIVFRSGRSGYKNLYIMDAEKGEEGGIRALTEGKWTDTMPHWSPDGQWIAFSSNRDNPEEEHFALFMVKPDGSELHKVMEAGRVNHVCFSPDSKSVVFTADLAGVTAEPISIPNQFQPYGEVFVARVDGGGVGEVVRLTMDGYENGTPVWWEGGLVGMAGEKVMGDFSDPIWLGVVTEEMRTGCC